MVKSNKVQEFFFLIKVTKMNSIHTFLKEETLIDFDFSKKDLLETFAQNFQGKNKMYKL